GYEIERAQPDADLELGGRAHALDDLAQEPRPILEGASVRTRARVCAQKLVAQIAMAMLEIDELRAAGLGDSRRANESLDQCPDLVVRHHRIVGPQALLAVEHRVAIEDLRLGLVLPKRSAEPAGMRELKADEQVVRIAERL